MYVTCKVAETVMRWCMNERSKTESWWRKGKGEEQCYVIPMGVGCCIGGGGGSCESYLLRKLQDLVTMAELTTFRFFGGRCAPPAIPAAPANDPIGVETEPAA